MFVSDWPCFWASLKWKFSQRKFCHCFQTKTNESKTNGAASSSGPVGRLGLKWEVGLVGGVRQARPVRLAARGHHLSPGPVPSLKSLKWSNPTGKLYFQLRSRINCELCSTHRRSSSTLGTTATIPGFRTEYFMSRKTILSYTNAIIAVRPQRSIETIASFDQWSGTIENHWKRW